MVVAPAAEALERLKQQLVVREELLWLICESAGLGPEADAALVDYDYDRPRHLPYFVPRPFEV